MYLCLSKYLLWLPPFGSCAKDNPKARAADKRGVKRMVLQLQLSQSRGHKAERSEVENVKAPC